MVVKHHVYYRAVIVRLHEAILLTSQYLIILVLGLSLGSILVLVLRLHCKLAPSSIRRDRRSPQGPASCLVRLRSQRVWGSGV